MKVTCIDESENSVDFEMSVSDLPVIGDILHFRKLSEEQKCIVVNIKKFYEPGWNENDAGRATLSPYFAKVAVKAL